MGILPARSVRIFAPSLSTQITSLPLSAKQAPATSPTYPVPMTAIFIRFVSLWLVIVPCRRAHPRRLPDRLAGAYRCRRVHSPIGARLYGGLSRRTSPLHEFLERSACTNCSRPDRCSSHRPAHPCPHFELPMASARVAAC